MMDFELIERLMRTLEQSTLNELDVTEGGMRIRLAKQRSNSSGAANSADLRQATHKPTHADPEALGLTIRAGMAGTFYRSPSPGARAFVEIGSLVQEGDQLGIIEAMKMLNPVEAERDGIVVAIHVADGGSVEPGSALFDVEPD
jgi:acetyl-CoA carboxylase biotin carboxyl carrier protein